MAGNFYNYIVPDLEKNVAKYKKRGIFFGIGVLLAFVGTAVAGGLIGSSFKFQLFPIIVLPMMLVPLCAVSMAISLGKFSQGKVVIGVKEHIKAVDKILIVDLTPLANVSESQVLIVVKKLIETGNLDEYEIIADVMVARKSLRLRESEAVEDYRDFKKAQHGIFDEVPFITNCPGCGAVVDDKNSKYCSYCGRPLR